VVKVRTRVCQFKPGDEVYARPDDFRRSRPGPSAPCWIGRFRSRRSTRLWPTSKQSARKARSSSGWS